MKKLYFSMAGKTAMVLAAAAMIGAFPVQAESNGPVGQASIQQRIKGTLQSRVNLLAKLSADYEAQFKKGSLGWLPVMKAKILLYKAELLRMKADAGRAPEPGIAIAVIDLYAAAAYAKDFQKRFQQGNLSLSLLLNAQLQANDAELKYLTLLKRCRNPEAVETVRKKLPVFDPAKRLDAKLLRELFEAELKAD